MLKDVINRGSSNQEFRQADGILYFYDLSRNKWISISRNKYIFMINHKNINHDRWMAMIDGLYSINIGYPINRDSIITSLIVKTENLSNCIFRVRKNNVSTDIETITLSNENYKVIDNIDTNIDKDDWIQVLLEITSNYVDNPIIEIETAFRE